MFCWAFSIRDLESNESLVRCEDIRHSTCSVLYIHMTAYVCVCVNCHTACEHVKLYVGEGKRNNSMHVIHSNNQPMPWIITNCEHSGTLGEILNCNPCLNRCKYKEQNPRCKARKDACENAQQLVEAHRMFGTGRKTVKAAFLKLWWENASLCCTPNSLDEETFHSSLMLSNWPLLIHSAWHTYCAVSTCMHPWLDRLLKHFHKKKYMTLKHTKALNSYAEGSGPSLYLTFC